MGTLKLHPCHDRLYWLHDKIAAYRQTTALLAWDQGAVEGRKGQGAQSRRVVAALVHMKRVAQESNSELVLQRVAGGEREGGGVSRLSTPAKLACSSSRKTCRYQ